MVNIKRHDSAFKWLISSLANDFFDHYYPQFKIGRIQSLDKEFIEKYDALKNDIDGDLFLALVVETPDGPQNVVIVIEHKSRREDVGRQLFTYACYAWLLRREPVWTVAFFTDDTYWRDEHTSGTFCYSFNREGKQHHRFDIIKINDEKSSDLVAQKSLFCKILALKADDRGCNREALLRQLIRAVVEMGDSLSEDLKLLIDRFILEYSKVPEPRVEAIKKEEHMSFPAATITEFYIQEGEARGEARGLAKGEARGLAKGEARGLAKGLAKALVRQMTKKFGDVPDQVINKINAADIQQLEVWTDNILDATTLDQVFA